MPQLPFSPERDGFAFNNTWHLAEPDKKRWLALLAAAEIAGFGVLVRDKRWRRGWLKWGLAALLQLAGIIAYRKLNRYTYGLCGGMSFTEMDYYRARQPIPLSGITAHPEKDNPDQAQVRAYIWKRTLDSLILNTPRVIYWMALVHLHPHHHQVILSRTRQEMEKLKALIDAGSPWPICLIGTTWSPFLNHQVLAVGYEETATGITLSVHDSNCPARLSQIHLEFTPSRLVSRETCVSRRRGPVQAVFCETYTTKQPSLAD